MVVDKLNVNLSGEHFLDALDAAAEAMDRDAVTTLSHIAFARRNLRWQAACRHTDNYIIAIQRENVSLQVSCQEAFMRLVPEIRKD